MLSYFVVNNRKLFYKSDIDLWLEDVVAKKRIISLLFDRG